MAGPLRPANPAAYHAAITGKKPPPAQEHHRHGEPDPGAYVRQKIKEMPRGRKIRKRKVMP